MTIIRRSSARLAVAVVLAWTLCSCASVPKASASVDASAKQFQVPAGKARVYLVRASGFAPGVVFRADIDARTVALLAVHTYVVADLEPGEHTFVAAGHENEDSVKLNVESGRAYFLRIGPRPGWLFARAAVYEIPEAEGRQLVLRASLVKGF